MNKYFKIFIKNALISGIIIGLIMLFLEMKYFKLSGILYGAIPIGFLYIMFSYYLSDLSYDEKIFRLLNFSKFSLIGGFLFLIFMSSYYTILKKTHNFIWSTFSMFLLMIVGIIIIIKYISTD